MVMHKRCVAATLFPPNRVFEQFAMFHFHAILVRVVVAHQRSELVRRLLVSTVQNGRRVDLGPDRVAAVAVVRMIEHESRGVVLELKDVALARS